MFGVFEAISSRSDIANQAHRSCQGLLGLLSLRWPGLGITTAGRCGYKEEFEVYVSPENQGLAPLFLASPQPDQPDLFTDDDPLARPGSSKDL